MGQCSEAAKAKLEAKEDWSTVKFGQNLIKLLNTIQSLMRSQIETNQQVGLTAFELLKTLMNVKQNRDEETADYRKHFIATADVL